MNATSWLWLAGWLWQAGSGRLAGLPSPQPHAACPMLSHTPLPSASPPNDKPASQPARASQPACQSQPASLPEPACQSQPASQSQLVAFNFCGLLLLLHAISSPFCRLPAGVLQPACMRRELQNNYVLMLSAKCFWCVLLSFLFINETAFSSYSQ